jgi:crotonobetainyl-CoA:carnitine CoA-transferase CaiB-like acyl-CoA transferase
MSGGPLEGVRIVDLTSVVVGPLATQILADHGAEVIKVESPSGDLGRTIGGLGVTPGMGPKFLHLNRNKRSIVLDLKKPAGYEALMRLIERADVLVWNVRPGSMARMKLSYDDVRKVNPKIIYCGMFGFGQGGRYRKKPAYDSIIQGSTGVAALYHRAAGEPRYLPMVVADKTVGLIAVQMMLMALFHRERTGEGQSIEIPMFENMAAFVLSEHMYMKTFEPPRGTTGDPRLLDPQAKPLATKDGWIALSANTNAQAFAFFDAIGRPELKTDPRFDSVATRFNNVGEYFRIRAEALKEKTTAEWLDIFDACDVPAMPYHTLDSLMEDPHLK